MYKYRPGKLDMFIDIDGNIYTVVNKVTLPDGKVLIELFCLDKNYRGWFDTNTLINKLDWIFLFQRTNRTFEEE